MPSEISAIKAREDMEVMKEFAPDFSSMEDEDVAVFAQNGNEEALEYLLYKYKNVVRSKARSYFLVGADREDIIQEGMIGLYKAIRDYKPERAASFHGFAELCITRHIISAVKSATRLKHTPLNSYVSLNKSVFDEDSDRTLLDVLPPTTEQDPQELYIRRENRLAIEEKLTEILSSFEWEVLNYYLQDKSYQEISVIMHRRAKSVDNALQRIKRKLEKYLNERQD